MTFQKDLVSEAPQTKLDSVTEVKAGRKRESMCTRSEGRESSATWSGCNVLSGGEGAVEGDGENTGVELVLTERSSRLPEFDERESPEGRVACMKLGAFWQRPLLRGRQFTQQVWLLMH